MQKTARGALRQALLLVLASTLICVPHAALAAKKGQSSQKKGTGKQGAKQKVVLGAFTGPKSGEVREWATTGLDKADNVTLVKDEKAASVPQGSSESDYASVAGASGAAALVVGKVHLQKKVGWSVTLWVHNGKNGKLIEKLTVRGGLLPGLRKKIENNLGAILAPALEKAEGGEAPAAAAAPAAAGKKIEGAEEVTLEEEPSAAGTSMNTEESPFDDEESSESAAPTSTVTGVSPLELRLGLRLYQRDFSYSDTLSDYDPAAYQPLLVHKTAAGSPMFIFSGNLYPLAFFTTGPLANIGFMIGYEEGFLTKTSLPDPYDSNVSVRELNQTHTEAYFGVRYRLMLGAQELTPYVSFGTHSFLIEDDKYPYLTSTGELEDYYDALPDVTYTYIDLGIAPRFSFGSFSLGGHAAYRLVSDTGGLQQVGPPDQPYDTWFPNAKGHGVTAGLYVGYAVTPLIDVMLGGDFTRYGFDFNHIPTVEERTTTGQLPIPAARVAGGATDTYVSGWLGIGVRFPGSEIEQAAETPADEVEDPDNEDVEELDF